MEIQTLKVFLTEDEINLWLPKVLPRDLPIRNLRVRLAPEGIVVQGEYPTMLLKMSFETLWEVGVEGIQIKARLASIKVAGLPAGILRGVLIKALRDAAAKEEGVHVGEDSLLVDVEKALRARGVPVQVRARTLNCGAGTLLIEAGQV